MIDYFDLINMIITIISLLVVLINFIINLKSKEESNAISAASLAIAGLAFISLFISEDWGLFFVPVSWLLLLYSKKIPSLEKYESSIVWQFRIIILLPIFLTLILVYIFIGAITLIPDLITDLNNLQSWSNISEIPSSVITFLITVVVLTIFLLINSKIKERIKDSVKNSNKLSEEEKEEIQGYYDAVNNYNAMIAWGGVMLQSILFSILLILGGIHKLILKRRKPDVETGEDRFFGNIVNAEEYPIANTLFALGRNSIGVLILEYALFLDMIDLNTIDLPIMTIFFTIFLIFAIIPWGLIYLEINNKSSIYILSFLFLLLLFVQSMSWDNAVPLVAFLNMFNLPTIGQVIGNIIIFIAKWLIFLILTIITLKNLKVKKVKKEKKEMKQESLDSSYIPSTPSQLDSILLTPRRKQDESRFCTNCGQRNPVSSKFCRYCGVNLN